MRPIKEKFVINIQVTPDERWRRCRLESDAGEYEYKSFSKIFANQIIGKIKRDIGGYLENELPSLQESHMLEISEEGSYDEEDFPIFKNYSDLVKEVKITWKE